MSDRGRPEPEGGKNWRNSKALLSGKTRADQEGKVPAPVEPVARILEPRSRPCVGRLSARVRPPVRISCRHMAQRCWHAEV
ncbi:hypothetical protein ANANG_G00206490 [Anguilla anguilla]|uniref:Uncharacterized protein n=1 Tax=Anguilla anguilla TaxID=7936 RepID=A0A9D3M2P7_ANGAN|nr:hypothetical protein ANANG_G00206490 [Anguilla anguilla]